MKIFEYTTKDTTYYKHSKIILRKIMIKKSEFLQIYEKKRKKLVFARTSQYLYFVAISALSFT